MDNYPIELILGIKGKDKLMCSIFFYLTMNNYFDKCCENALVNYLKVETTPA